MINLSAQILSFLYALRLTVKLPTGVEVLNPYTDPVAKSLCEQFYQKFYSDNQKRTLILGINPGRFGGGITGIPFTDPVKLEIECEIPNTLKKKSELSADFIYQMIRAYGGPKAFYNRFLITAVCPLGFTREGKNLNYYDGLEGKVAPFILESINKQLLFNVNRDVCFCLGEGENYKFLSRLNAQHNFFGNIIPLAHPRFIMQYRRKKVDDYVSDYLLKFSSVR